MTAREKLMERVKSLPEAQARDLLHYLDDLEKDPIYRAFMDAPEEPPLEDELQAIRETDEEIKRGEGVPLEEIARRYQLQLAGKG